MVPDMFPSCPRIGLSDFAVCGLSRQHTHIMSSMQRGSVATTTPCRMVGSRPDDLQRPGEVPVVTIFSSYSWVRHARSFVKRVL